jgi:hypothetical protein
MVCFQIELDKLFSNIDKILDANCLLWQESFSKVLAETRSEGRPLNPSTLKQGFTQEVGDDDDDGKEEGDCDDDDDEEDNDEDLMM